MKRLPLTPQIVADIQAAVGEDVDTADFAVFETIAINDQPLPGKRGMLFERAVVTPLTLSKMADEIQNGNHQPIQFNHNMAMIPLGRAFKAELHNGANGEIELRTLFYVDPTNAEIAAKIDAGSLDEVSVSFLAEKILCSECGFDYRGEDADWFHIMERTCANGHEVGKNGVHVRLVGLEAFTELSLVSRGAAKNPKIVGKSASKLAPQTLALAARGFEIDELFLTASLGDEEVDLTTVLSKLEEQTTAAATAKAELASVQASLDAVTGERDAAQARVAELESELAAAKETNTDAEALAAAKAEAQEAREVLTDIFTRLATAVGSDKSVPETIADLKAGIEELNSELTAAIPAGGAAASTITNEPETGAKFNAAAASAFKSTR